MFSNNKELASSSTVAIVCGKLSARPKVKKRAKTKKAESSPTKTLLYYGRTVKTRLGMRLRSTKTRYDEIKEKFLFIFMVMVTLNHD